MSKRNTRINRDRSEIENMKDKPRVPHWTETVAPDSPQMEQLRKARDENDLVKRSREMAKMMEDKARQ